jgi:hypothetical protein
MSAIDKPVVWEKKRISNLKRPKQWDSALTASNLRHTLEVQKSRVDTNVHANTTDKLRIIDCIGGSVGNGGEAMSGFRPPACMQEGHRTKIYARLGVWMEASSMNHAEIQLATY